jgi:hypothetical protein
MTRFNPGARRRPASAAEGHRAWLGLVQTDGPFLSVPVLKDVWPQGMHDLGGTEGALAALRTRRPDFERAWDAWYRDACAAGARSHQEALAAYRPARDAWVRFVLRELAGWGALYDESQVAGSFAARYRASAPSGYEQVAPTGALVRQGEVGALVLVVDPSTEPLYKNYPSDAWSASALDRMAAMLRAPGSACSVGVVTDGRWWAVVSAPAAGACAWGLFDVQMWGEAPEVRRAFCELVSVRTLLLEREDRSLPALFARSVDEAEEVTDSLGRQVREAVELLVAAFDAASARAHAQGRTDDPLPADDDEVYQAAVTVMMRVVFLLFAQERGLLPQSELFVESYGLEGVLNGLEDRALEEGEESMDATSLAWHRLLAVSNVMYRGSAVEGLDLPAYGGSMFNPERHEFLQRTDAQGKLAVTVSDRVMLHVLRSVQTVSTKAGGEARRLSFKEIDVEQIGYIYEGLLGYTCRRTDECVLGLAGKRGEEPEVALAALEELAAAHPDRAALAKSVAAYVKANELGSASSPKAYEKALAQADPAETAVALRQLDLDPQLAQRLEPWMAIVRRDLRGRPVVWLPGGLYVAATSSRKDAGAHYTPRFLAEEVVEHALDPLVYEPGPLQTADRSAWKLVPARKILQLKVADIACGSGAFLVAAARYLAARLVEAWTAEGTAGDQGADELHLKALRKVVAGCLYGVDINPMAVEMCKLSLWLVSLDPHQPFSFVDENILVGNSLLGVTSTDEVRALRVGKANGAKKPARPSAAASLFQVEDARPQATWLVDMGGTLRDAANIRRELLTEVDAHDVTRTRAAKRTQMAEYAELVDRLRRTADGVVAAGLELGGKPGKQLDAAYEALAYAVGQAYPANGAAGDASELDAILRRGLTPTVPTDYERWQCVHWPLEFPEVFDEGRGGFDAVIGNPPFLGGQRLTGTQGTNVRDWYVNVLADGTRGSADLCAYFFLRAFSLIHERGTLGLLATNTIAQGATREVGLDQMVTRGFIITRAVRSAPWPSKSATLEYAAVWGSRDTVDADVMRICDGEPVVGISTLLEPQGRANGKPTALIENGSISFQGCVVLGKGFILNLQEAREWIAADPRNVEVVFPYLSGEDLNSRPDCAATRWVIDFNDRTEETAATYTLPFQRAVEQVRPERLRNNRKVYRDYWWQFAEKRPAMRKAIAGFDEVLVIAQVSSTVMPMRVSCNQVLSMMVVVLASDSYALQAILSSSLHQAWVIRWGSGMKGDPRYTPSDVFETFPRPTETPELDTLGRTLDGERRQIMLRRQLGLTKLYNLVNDPDLPNGADPDVARLRQIHRELDEAVVAAYGWDDVPLGHGFHEYRGMVRWTVCPAARTELLDRLLEENHRRAALQNKEAR